MRIIFFLLYEMKLEIQIIFPITATKADSQQIHQIQSVILKLNLHFQFYHPLRSCQIQNMLSRCVATIGSATAKFYVFPP